MKLLKALKFVMIDKIQSLVNSLNKGLVERILAKYLDLSSQRQHYYDKDVHTTDPATWPYSKYLSCRYGHTVLFA